MPENRPPAGAVDPFAKAVGVCPACEGPLHVWVTAPAADARDDEVVLDRCERCGAAIARLDAALPAMLDAQLDRLFAPPSNGSRRELRAPNRRSLQAGIGEGNWAAMELPRDPIVLTPQSLELLLDRRGAKLERVSCPPFGRNQLWMWQTLINALTFHPNFAREVAAGRLRPRGGVDRLTFALDALVTLLAAPLVALVSVPLEALAALARRGGEMRAELSARPAP